MASPEYIAAYNKGLVCVECTSPIKKGEPCGHCEGERQTAIAAGIIHSDDPASSTYVPHVLRPSIPEDLIDPPATPPYARCVEDCSLPENAGRHVAPDSSGIMETIKDLTDLRNVRAGR